MTERERGAQPRKMGGLQAQRLSNGRYELQLTAAGTGWSACDGQALTRFRGDAVEEADGLFFYLRDLDSGLVWSAGEQPVRRVPEAYEFSARPDRALIRRRDGDLETCLEVAVASGAPAELRRLRLANHGAAPRRVEVTSCLEAVLNAREADAAHPAFSKLFVQTEWSESGCALLARRRPRGTDEAPRWMCHWLERPEGGAVSCETDRARFLGRGRTMAAPLAMDAPGPLSGTTGSVLDPVLALRTELTLAPGEARILVFGLALASDREDALRTCAALASRGNGSPAVQAAGPVPVPVSGVPHLPAPRFLPPPAGASPVSSPGSVSGPVSGNGFGAFSEDGREYVMTLNPGADGRPLLPPLPWSNVLANEGFGFLATERGLSCTWNRNSRLHRLTPWINDPIADPLPEALYLRDEAARTCWSLTPGPAGQGLSYTVRHGFGATSWETREGGLEQEVLAFAPLDAPVQILRVRLKNGGDRERRLSLFWFAHLVLGESPAQTAGHVDTRREGEVLLARPTVKGVLPAQVAFATLLGHGGGAASTTDRSAFLGPLGTLEAPAAVVLGERLDGAEGPGQDPCFAFQAGLELAPGESRECYILFGEAEDEAAVRRVLASFASASACEAALAAVRRFWDDTLGGLQVSTPEPALDRMVNGWLAYQNLACRIWARTAYYQSGGAYGFRDQLQDAAALIYLRPDLTRRQILINAAHQFVEGDVLHWWHPPIEQGIRTKFSDDLLWLPFLTATYLQGTGDWGLLDEGLPYLEARLLGPEEDEAYLAPSVSAQSGDLYDHCCRALDLATTRIGAHGLPLMGTGDWNDGMNRVGRLGRGESVWMGFFLYTILEAFRPVCLRRGDTTRAERHARLQRNLSQALEEAGWDGAWYRRAYYDDGTPLGSADSAECRIDCLAQAWAVISKAVPEARARQAMAAAEAQLIDTQAGLIRLLAPPFDVCDHDPGYIKGYIPGVRENGGQYTHGALWAVKAFAELGDVDRAASLLAMLSPVTHSATPEAVATYQTEPYVIAADVYGVAPHTGRGGWTWYTGSAGWMYRVAVEDLLGFRLEGGEALILLPRLPQTWDRASLRYRDAGDGTVYDIAVERDPFISEPCSANLDGTVLTIEGGRLRIPHAHDGCVHTVRVRLGRVRLGRA